MGCPHTSDLRDALLSRRSFLQAALAIGGSSALSACLERAPLNVAGGPEDLSTLPTRQHAWNGFLSRDSHGNLVLPTHQLILFFEYDGASPPVPSERARVETALRTIESAFQRGTGGTDPYSAQGVDAEGLLFTIGYSPLYFARFDEEPTGVDLPRPESILSDLDEDPGKADPYDAALVCCSDDAKVLLATEQALLGNLDELNEVDVEASFEGVFTRVDRRTGFKGIGNPHERLDMEEIPEESPAAMGYKSGFRDNQASQDRVTIQEGPFAGGTTQHISLLGLGLDEWYDQEESSRVSKMFSPHHTSEQVGDAGEFLANDSGVTPEISGRTREDAHTEKTVGHTQKTARARDDAFEPLILRRSEGITTSGERPGLNFTSVQRGIEDFVETRRAMDGDDLPSMPEENNGILHYIETRTRGNYLIPPRPLRALPPAAPDR